MFTHSIALNPQQRPKNRRLSPILTNFGVGVEVRQTEQGIQAQITFSTVHMCRHSIHAQSTVVFLLQKSVYGAGESNNNIGNVRYHR
jgi:hypothetical protein